jgi:hypothetical protein
MKILKISGETNEDQRTALREALAVWKHGGTCYASHIARTPRRRVEILIAANERGDGRAIIVIENGIVIVGFHPLDEPAPDTIH